MEQEFGEDKDWVFEHYDDLEEKNLDIKGTILKTQDAADIVKDRSPQRIIASWRMFIT